MMNNAMDRIKEIHDQEQEMIDKARAKKQEARSLAADKKDKHRKK
jgi:hypothetical protein